MKKITIILCGVWWLVSISTFVYGGNCAWWSDLDKLSRSLSETVKHGYIMGAYCVMGDLYGIIYVANDVPIENIKKILATKENIIVVIANVDIFCGEKRNAFVSLPLYLELLLRIESGITRVEDMSYEEEILRDLLPVGNP